jgi:hypothetical protein
MNRNRHLQSGTALLLLLVLLAGLGIFSVFGQLSSTRMRLEQEALTNQALQQAKEALLAWSATHKTTPGRLPCPEDTSTIGSVNEGKALSSCSNSTVQVGRLPWRTLDTQPLRDANGEPLWYVLSPGFRASPPPGSAGVTTGQLELDSATAETAALIIAPGVLLAGQNRPLPSALLPPQRSDYLDQGNASGTSFTSSGAPGAFNDRVIVVTSQDIKRALSFRVLAEIRGAFELNNGLRRYFSDNDEFPPDGTPLEDSLIFDTPTRNWLSPASNPSLWFDQVTYDRVSPTLAHLSLGNVNLTVSPCITSPCP